MTEITKDNLCITSSEGNELTSTFFITSKLTIEVTDAYNLRQLFKGLLEAELLRRTFNRGARSVTLHNFLRKRSKTLKKPFQRGARSVFAHHLQKPQQLEYRQPSSGTFKGKNQKIASNTETTMIAETPVATQQTAAISHSILLAQLRNPHEQRVSNKVSISKTQGTSINSGEIHDHDLPYRGQGHTNISWK